MRAYDKNGNIIFRELTNKELLYRIQHGLVTMSFEENSKTRHALRDETYDDIHELFMRLNLYEIVYGTSVMDAWKNTVDKEES